MPTSRELIATTAEFLNRKGVPAGKREAELLLAHVLGTDRMRILGDLDRPLIPAEVDAFREVVKRRAQREPYAYIVGHKGFWKHDFAVDARVLIPRPETELIVERLVSELGRQRLAPWRIVDVGTGSGCLAISLAHEFPQATVVAVDISPDALEVARVNAEALGVRDRVKLVRGDLLEPLLQRSAKVDVVVSNPPYVGTGERDRMDEEVKRHEPGAALWAGEDGLSLIRTLVTQSARVLEPGGRLIVEHGDRQGPACRELASAAGFAEVATVKDYARLNRLLVGRLPGEPPERTANVPLEETPAKAPTVLPWSHKPATGSDGGS